MAETNSFGIPDAGSGGDTPQQPWDFGGTPGESGRIAKGIGAVKSAAGGALGKTGERIGGVAGSIGHAASHIHRPEIHRPDIHMPHIPRPDLTGAKNAAGDVLGRAGEAIGGAMGGAGERIGHVAEAFRTVPVREAISHAVTGVTGRIPRPEFVGEVARRSVSALANREFLGQSLLDLTSGAVVSGGTKTVLQLALGMSGVGTLQVAVLGLAGGAASAGVREFIHQKREFSEAADDTAREELKRRFKESHRMRNAIIRGAVFGAVGGVVGGEIAGAILDRISVPEVNMPNIQGPDLGSVSEALGGAKSAVGGGLGRAGEAIGGVAGGIGGGAGGALGGAGETIGGAGGTVGEAARNVPGLGGAQDLLGNAGKTVGDTLGGAGKAIGDIWQERFGSAPAQPDLDKMQAMQAIDDQQQMLDAAEARERAQQLAEEARRVAPAAPAQPEAPQAPVEAAPQTPAQPVTQPEAPQAPAQPAMPEPIPPTNVYGHEVSGSAIDDSLKFDGKTWELVGNGTKNIGNLFSVLGEEAVPVDKAALAENLQKATTLWAQGQLTYAAYPEFYDLFHLANGTASEYPGLLNKDTLDVLRNLRIIAK